MSHVIFKYDIDTPGVNYVSMPRGAQILSTDIQHGVPRVWALVDPVEAPEMRRIAVYPTGQLLDEVGNFVGTLLATDGLLVLHVFELSAAKPS